MSRHKGGTGAKEMDWFLCNLSYVDVQEVIVVSAMSKEMISIQCTKPGNDFEPQQMLGMDVIGNFVLILPAHLIVLTTLVTCCSCLAVFAQS